MKLKLIEKTSKYFADHLGLSEYLLLAFDLEVGGISREVSFMVFLSLPKLEELDVILEKDEFSFLLIDDGRADILFKKQADKSYVVVATDRKDISEQVNVEDIRKLVQDYWSVIKTLLGEGYESELEKIIEKTNEDDLKMRNALIRRVRLYRFLSIFGILDPKRWRG